MTDIETTSRDMAGVEESDLKVKEYLNTRIAEDKDRTERRTQEEPNGFINMAYIFEQIRAIQNQTDYLKDVVEVISLMSDGDSGESYSPGNHMGTEKARALGDIVRCRETTNQQMLSFYASVYNDLKPQS